MKPNVTTLIIVTLVIAAGAYWYISTRTGNELPLTGTLPSENAAQTQFQRLVVEMQSISFVTDIFSDPRFSSLVNLSTPITPESLGRLDPFAPLGPISSRPAP